MNLFGGVIPIKEITFFMFAIFAIIVAGFALGRITIKGISLGDAGVFIMALVFGCLFYDKLDAQLVVKTVQDGVSTSISFTERLSRSLRTSVLYCSLRRSALSQVPSSSATLRKTSSPTLFSLS